MSACTDDLRGNLALSNCFKVEFIQGPLFRLCTRLDFSIRTIQSHSGATAIWEPALLIWIHLTQTHCPWPFLAHPHIFLYPKLRTTQRCITSLCTVRSNIKFICFQFGWDNLLTCVAAWIYYSCATDFDLLSVQWNYNSALLALHPNAKPPDKITLIGAQKLWGIIISRQSLNVLSTSQSFPVQTS